MKFLLYNCFFAVLISSCVSNRNGSEEQLYEVVDSFANNYFNLRYSNAMRFCTDDSHRWLKWAASNVTQEDIDVLHKTDKAASVQVESAESINDSLSTVRITVNNYLLMDSIGKPGRIVKSDNFIIRAIIKDGKWLVRMEALPRSEKKSHD